MFITPRELVSTVEMNLQPTDRQREDREVGGVGGFSFGVVADETDKGDSMRYIRFSLFCPLSRAAEKRVGAAPKIRSCFSRGTGTGEPEPEPCNSKAEAS
jgi:hypothetical protein